MVNTEEAAPVVVITGGSRGIGLALVQAFKAQGTYWVASCARTLSRELQASADFVMSCDLSVPGAGRDFIAAVRAQQPKIRVLINNAGIAEARSLGAVGDDAHWQASLATNLFAAFEVTRASLGSLEDQRSSIIMITSVLAHRGLAEMTAYCAAKHGLLGFTRALALELAPRGIRVNAIAPGWVRTQMAAERAAAMGSSVEQLPRSVPMGRIVEPEEVAALALYLVSEVARSITGQSLCIDGGFLA